MSLVFQPRDPVYGYSAVPDPDFEVGGGGGDKVDPKIKGGEGGWSPFSALPA